MEPYVALAVLAAGQHGCLHRSQALNLGLTSSSWDRLPRLGFRGLHPGVVALPGAPGTPARTIMAALLAAGPSAAAACWSALWVWGLVRAAPSTVDLILEHGRRSPRLSGVRGRRSRTIRPEDIREVNGIRVTCMARTLCDLCSSVSVAYLRSLVIDARQRRLTTLAEISLCIARVGRLAGIGRLKRVVWELSEERCDSILEYAIRKILRTAGLVPFPEPYAITYRGQTIHADIAFPHARVAIECDGFGSHSQRVHGIIDRKRLNLFREAGWQVVHVGWEDLEDPVGLVAKVRAALVD